MLIIYWMFDLLVVYIAKRTLNAVFPINNGDYGGPHSPEIRGRIERKEKM